MFAVPGFKLEGVVIDVMHCVMVFHEMKKTKSICRLRAQSVQACPGVPGSRHLVQRMESAQQSHSICRDCRVCAPRGL